jgi:DNA-binding PadR family transcriptional regulator
MGTASRIDTHLPLSEQAFQILLSLTDQELHGYAIIKDVEERTGGGIVLSASTLYSALKRMRNAELIEELEKRPSPDLDDERRRYYAISSLGRQVARGEAERVAGLAEMARDKSLLPSSVRPA